MIRAVLLAAISLAVPLVAQTAPPKDFARQIVLWLDGAPQALHTGAAATEGDIPKLFVYPATTATPSKTAVIVLPGGGFTHLVMDGEGSQEARWLATHGITAFVLEYRLSPAYRFPVPMLDVSRGIRYVRAHAAEFGISPSQIGIWGFSAGGYLTAYASTTRADDDPLLPQVPARPDFAIISYGRMAMGAEVPRPDPGKSPAMEDVLKASTATLDILPRVTADTSPSFLYSTTGDQTVDSRNATLYYNALKAAKVPAELHIFELGAHGTHMGLDRPPAERELTVVPTLLLNWLALHHWIADQP